MSKLGQRIERHWPSAEWTLAAGASPGCEECFSWLDEGQEPTEDDMDMAHEPSFSYSECEGCGSYLARRGARHSAHAIERVNGKVGEIIHIEVCTDCLVYIANGDLPEED